MTQTLDPSTTQAAAHSFDVEAVRSHFPSLGRVIEGRQVAYLDGPAGTQVPQECIDGISSYLRTSNANSHGAFAASAETDALLDEAHAAAADFLGADDPGEIAFGPNMTTLTFAVSRAIGRTLAPGDEIIVTRLDHDANVAPWLHLAEDRGAVIRWVPIRETDCTLDLDVLADSLGPRTRLVAVGLASNAVGTINPIKRIAEMAHAAGARIWVDAVHAAPHLPIDVQAMDVDYLVCSAYKFYGPHLGILWGRRELLEALPAYKVRPAGDDLPHRFETGTQAHELLAGLMGTFEYLEWLGSSAGPDSPTISRAATFRAAITASRAWERDLVLKLIAEVGAVPGVHIHGITDPARVGERCPTIAFTVDGHHPRDVAAFLGKRAISTWDGDYYAWELVRALGLAELGGMVRVGLVHYNTPEEIDRLVNALSELVSRR
jgi:cysteine desulfurase family protein (TIGR01976 family)